MKELIIASILIFASVSAFAEQGNSVSESEQGMLTIYRTADNSAINYRLMVDGKHIGRLKPNSAINLPLRVGEHVITSNDRNKTKLKVLVDGDGVTYIREEVDKRARISLTVDEPTDYVVEKIAARSRVAQIK